MPASLPKWSWLGNIVCETSAQWTPDFHTDFQSANLPVWPLDSVNTPDTVLQLRLPLILNTATISHVQ